jgi:hypothetical protein
MDWHEKHSRAFGEYIDDERLGWVPSRQYFGNGRFTYVPLRALLIEIATPKMGPLSLALNVNDE